MGSWAQTGAHLQSHPVPWETRKPLEAHGPATLVCSAMGNERACLEQAGRQGTTPKAVCDLHIYVRAHAQTHTLIPFLLPPFLPISVSSLLLFQTHTNT